MDQKKDPKHKNWMMIILILLALLSCYMFYTNMNLRKANSLLATAFTANGKCSCADKAVPEMLTSETGINSAPNRTTSTTSVTMPS